MSLPGGTCIESVDQVIDSNSVVYSYSIPSSGGYAANGDLLSYTDSVMGQWSFSYDKLDRLMTGTPSSGPYQGQYGCWGYDSFGNRTINVVSAAACTTTATATYNANNQITWLQTLGAPGYPSLRWRQGFALRSDRWCSAIAALNRVR